MIDKMYFIHLNTLNDNSENTNLGEVSLYGWPLVYFVWIKLIDI